MGGLTVGDFVLPAIYSIAILVFAVLALGVASSYMSGKYKDSDGIDVGDDEFDDLRK